MKTVRNLLLAAAAGTTLVLGGAALAADDTPSASQPGHRHDAKPAGERHQHGMHRMRNGCAFDAGQKRG